MQEEKLLKLLTSLKQHMPILLGYPLNTNLYFDELLPFYSCTLNNAGDPYHPMKMKLDSKEFEKEVIAFFGKLYADNSNDIWGYVTSGGTEGNIYGILLGREKFPDGILYYSEDSHYSIEKIAKLLSIGSVKIKSQNHGEIDYKELEKALRKNRNKPAIFCLNIGTTFKGAIDDVDKVMKTLKIVGVNNFYIHADAALFGMMLPFIKGAPKIKITNIGKGISSISISGHKFIGSPFPCGIVLTLKEIMKKNMQDIEYLHSVDSTILGSRNGHTPLVLWYAIHKKGRKGFTDDVTDCIENAKYLYNKLNKMGIESHLNKFSNTVYFTKPDEALIDKWQLSTLGNYAHVVVMPQASKSILDEFTKQMNGA